MSDPTFDVVHMGRADFAIWLAEHDRKVSEKAWDDGHVTPQRRGPDECECFAYSSGECACGLFGTGPLLSSAENPYRKAVDE